MSSAIVVLLVAFASANAGIIAPAAQILQGPSSRTTLVGPDGSSISAVAPGGSVITDQQPALVAQTLPVAPAVVASRTVVSSPALLSAPSVVAAPSLLSAPGVIATSGLISAPVVARSGLVASGLGETIIAGPSGTITAAGPLAAPGVISPLAVW